VIRKEARPFYRTISGVRLCWELEEPKGPKGPKLEVQFELDSQRFEHHPLAASREPSALEGWILEVLYCGLKGSRATEERGVRLKGHLAHKKTPNPL